MLQVQKFSPRNNISCYGKILKMQHRFCRYNCASPVWIAWINLWLRSAKASLLVNGIVGREVARRRGLRRRDSLSPLIFVLVANGLHFMIKRCRDRRLIKGLGCLDEINKGINLHYADDTLIFERYCMTEVRTLKWILQC